MNYYIKNNTLYLRKKITLSFVVKKQFADEAREALNTALSEAGLDVQVSAVDTASEAPAEKPADLPEQVKPEENGTQNTAEAAAPANDSAQTAQKEVDKETLNLFQKFLQWVKGLAGKN